MKAGRDFYLVMTRDIGIVAYLLMMNFEVEFNSTNFIWLDLAINKLTPLLNHHYEYNLTLM